MGETMTGGCQCGRIRYEVRVADDRAYLCHCTMCRRATGGVAAAFRAVAAGELRWLGDMPDLYASSPIANRGFCSTCGTPLTFAYVDGDGGMDLTVGSFDDPGHFRPVKHVCAETRLAAWLDTAQLPCQRSEANAGLAARWAAAGLAK